jgi:hypothetical protein
MTVSNEGLSQRTSRHYVKVWTSGKPDTPNYRIYGATGDRVYLLNFKEVLK